MEGFVHRVQYYETDKMGIVHHSNYIRWMEEARVFYLEKIGLPYQNLEEMGIVSPVVSVSFEYKMPAKFADDVYIELFLRKYNGIKMIFEYTLKDSKGNIFGYASSKHCFIDNDNKPMSIKCFEDVHNKLLDVIDK